MGYSIKSLTFLFSGAFLFGCGQSQEAVRVQVEQALDAASIIEPAASPEPDLQPIHEESGEPSSGSIEKPGEAWWMRMPWENTVRPLAFDEEGTPIPLELHPRSYFQIKGKTKDTTIEVHRQIAKALGLKVDDKNTPDLAKFLSTRASIETSMQGNQRPFDNRGAIHSLDIRAAYKSGIRNRKTYVEAGNELAKHEPHVFLGYGQGGMISWLFLDNWDLKGDPRMLGDNVIGGLTYQRSLVKHFERMEDIHIRCYEYDDEGTTTTHSFNGNSYRTRSFSYDEEAYDECVASGPESSREKRHPDSLKKRCEIENRNWYRWKPGAPQPDNTVPVTKITWWQLKRASGGRPCPPWKGDEYERKSKERFLRRAQTFGLDGNSVVRRKDLGYEPEGIGQYDLWKSIWDSTMEALGEPSINWDNLMEIGTEEPVVVKPTKEKVEQSRRRARGETLNPLKNRRDPS